MDVYVNTRVKWPHEFVFSGTNKERVTYVQLYPVQQMAGFCQTIRDQPEVKICEHMLDYVIQLLHDAQDFLWCAAKASMQCCSAVWSRGKLVVGQIVKKLNAYGVPRPRDMLLPPPPPPRKRSR